MNLEKLSFENLTNFYAEELRQIAEGLKISEIINDNTRFRLVKHGVLQKRSPQHWRAKLRLTPRAREVLGLD